jgi:hypothetical protein
MRSIASNRLWQIKNFADLFREFNRGERLPQGRPTSVFHKALLVKLETSARERILVRITIQNSTVLVF